jgi:hypothetical protein
MSDNVLVLSDSDASLDKHRALVEAELGIQLQLVNNSTDAVFFSPLGWKSSLSLYGDSDLEDVADIKCSRFPIAVDIDTRDETEGVNAARRVAQRIAGELKCETIVVLNYGKLLATFNDKTMNEGQ